MEKKSKSPFMSGTVDGLPMEAMDAESRLYMVKEMDADELRAVLAYGGVQVTVRRAAERRLRKLEQQQ